jgi:probable HAF family extracellular repeat protein
MTKSTNNPARHGFLIFFGIVLLGPLALAQKYAITDLGPLNPTSINKWGQIVGDYNGHAHMWTVTDGLQDLGTIPGGTFSRAAAINDLGVVTGTGNGRGTVISKNPRFNTPDMQCANLTQPFVWKEATGMQGLGTIGSDAGYVSPQFWCFVPYYATDVNLPGHLVGYSGNVSTFQLGFVWTYNAGMDWVGGNWPPTFANGINNSDLIVGQQASPPYKGRAASWKDGDITYLGTLGVGDDSEYSSSANGVNDLGQVVGWSSTTPTSFGVASSVHAVRWTSNGQISDLGTLPGDTSSAAYKINFFGEAIGSSGNTPYYDPNPFSQILPFQVIGRPFVWSEREGMRDLNRVIKKKSGWVLYSANDINIWGQIVGLGTWNGEVHGFLLTPKKLLKY